MKSGAVDTFLCAKYMVSVIKQLPLSYLKTCFRVVQVGGIRSRDWRGSNRIKHSVITCFRWETLVFIAVVDCHNRKLLCWTYMGIVKCCIVCFVHDMKKIVYLELPNSCFPWFFRPYLCLLVFMVLYSMSLQRCGPSATHNAPRVKLLCKLKNYWKSNNYQLLVVYNKLKSIRNVQIIFLI